MAQTISDIVARLTLRDVRKFQTDAERARFALHQLDRQGTALRTSMVSAAKGMASFGMTAATTLVASVGIGAAAVTGFGIKMAGSLEQTQIAFETMTGSAQVGQQTIKDLQKFARETPFQFQDLVGQTQRLLAYGFALEDIIPMLTNMGDAAAGLSLGSEGIERMTTALGQMQAKGRVQSQELLQLQEAGIPALQTLAKGLNMTTGQMMKAVELGKVQSDVAIPILLKGMEDKFGGLMDRQSKTLFGLISNAKDYAIQTLQGMYMPFLPFLEAGLTKLNSYMPKLQEEFVARSNVWITRMKEQFRGVSLGDVFSDPTILGPRLDVAFGSGDTFTTLLNQWVPVLQDLWTLLKDGVFPALMDIASVALPLMIGGLQIGLIIMGFFSDHSTLAQVAVWLLAGAIVTFYTAMGIANAVFTVYNMWILLTTARTQFMTLWHLISMSTMGTYVGVIWLSVAAWLASAAASALALWPIYAIIIGIGLLVAGVIWAWKNWGWFHDTIAGFWDFISNIDWGELGKNIVNGLAWPINWLIRAWNALDFSIDFEVSGIPGMPKIHTGDLIPDIPEIPALALGGTTVKAGRVLVGERGPELLDLPVGASVIPLDAATRSRVTDAVRGGGSGGSPTTIQLVLDRRVLAEVTVDELKSERARK